MKCDELQYEKLGDMMPFYPRSTLVIRKQFVDEAIAELKDKINEFEIIPHTDNSAVIELLSDELEKLRPMEAALEIAEADNKKYIGRINELESENDRLKNEKKKMYTKLQHDTIIDAMSRSHLQELRDTKRALWMARASNASSFAGLFSTLSYIDDDETRTYWIFGNKRKIVIDGLKCSRMETSYKWFCIWDDVANKCLKKAKEYK